MLSSLYVVLAQNILEDPGMLNFHYPLHPVCKNGATIYMGLCVLFAMSIRILYNYIIT